MVNLYCGVYGWNYGCEIYETEPIESLLPCVPPRPGANRIRLGNRKLQAYHVPERPRYRLRSDPGTSENQQQGNRVAPHPPEQRHDEEQQQRDPKAVNERQTEEEHEFQRREM